MKKNILIVDDNPLILRLMTKLLEKEGHRVATAEDAFQALELLTVFTPDIIFVDLILPKINGEKLIAILRKMKHLNGCYFVVISAAAPEIGLDPAAIGANSLIAKGPFNYMSEHILATVAESESPEKKAVATPIKGIEHVSVRRMTQELLSRSRHLETILDSISEGILEIFQKKVVYANHAASFLFGFPQETLLTSYLPDLFEGELRSEFEALLSTEGQPQAFIHQGRPVDLNGNLVTIQRHPLKGEASTSIILVTDVTERTLLERRDRGLLESLVEKRTAELTQANERLRQEINERIRTEKALAQSEFQFRTFFDLSPQPIAQTRLGTGKIIDINQKFCELTKFSREEIIGRTPVEIGLYSQDNRRIFLETLKKNGDVNGLEMDFKAKNDDILHMLMFARQIEIDDETYILTIFHDLTEHKQLEIQLRTAQKLEAIGTLAGGIAHNFNNLLMGIDGYASLARLDTGPDHAAYDRLEKIETLVHNGSKLTEQLLGYARGGKYELVPIDLNRLIKNISETFGWTKREINMHLDLAENLSRIEADQAQIEQVLLNLYVNSFDAMPQGGDFYLKTENTDHHRLTHAPYRVKEGKYVCLTIRDTGAGMDKETVHRIFDPFFTTKGLGISNGLGLASAYGIIKSHNGYINVSSEPNVGTTFEIYLPATTKEAVAKKEVPRKLYKGSQTILLVDDETMIIDVGKQILRKMGYDVHTADSGKEAVEIIKECRHRVDLVILDMIMPGMSGKETFDRIKTICPKMKILLSSGYSIDGQASEIMACGCDGFIQKPFGIEQLSHALRDILNKR
jgi:two-component system, cell cycle sensor histidine kinase and response regulator CckA